MPPIKRSLTGSGRGNGRGNGNKARSSVLVSTTDALRRLKSSLTSPFSTDTNNSSTDNPTDSTSSASHSTGTGTGTSTGSTSTGTVTISWKNIWCANHWEYTPIQYAVVTHIATAKQQVNILEDFDPAQWKNLSNKSAGRFLLVRPIFDDVWDVGRVQRVEKLYHHLADNVSWAPLNDSHCDCVPGPHAEFGYILNGYKVIRWEDVDESTGVTNPRYKVVKCPLPREVLLEGGRGSGKSEDFFAFIQRGRPGAKADKPEEQCYLNHPAYRCLVLRKNFDDLKDFFDRVERFLEKHFTLVQRNRSEMFITLSTGAKIIFGHLADEKAFSNYIGHEYHSIWIEELGLLAKEEQYVDIMTCARSGQYSEITPMIAGSTNPGGQGAAWIEARFINVKDSKGKDVPASTLIYDPVGKSYRIRIHSTVLDNPYTLKTGYYDVLNAIPSVAKRIQWLEGSWNVKSGVMFSEFRRQWVRYCEGDAESKRSCICGKCDPQHACHIVPMSPDVNVNGAIIHRQPYPDEPLVLSGDVGFTHHACFHKARMKSNGQLHVTGELVKTEQTLKQWGVEVAAWIAQELELVPNKRAVLFLSPDAFGQRGMEMTQAQQLSAGIEMVLGKKASIVMASEFSYEEDEKVRVANREQWQLLNAQKGLRLIIRPANNKRVDGWNWLHELLRWRDLRPQMNMTFDADFAARLLHDDKTEEYLVYTRMFMSTQDRTKEVLPKLVFNSNCHRTTKALTMLINDPKKLDDVKDQKEWWNDVGDSLRYLAMGYRTISEHEPEAVYVNRSVNDWKHQRESTGHVVSPNQQMIMQMVAQIKYQDEKARKSAPAFSIERGTGRLIIQ